MLDFCRKIVLQKSPNLALANDAIQIVKEPHVAIPNKLLHCNQNRVAERVPDISLRASA